MVREKETRYGIQELVQLTGVPRRTIRYYVQRELMDPPLGAGRGHFYTDAHLARLRTIRDLQAKGHSLEEIGLRLARGESGKSPVSLPPLELATRILIAPGIELLVSHGAEAPTPSQLRALAAAAQEIFD